MRSYDDDPVRSYDDDDSYGDFLLSGPYDPVRSYGDFLLISGHEEVY